MEGSAHTCKDIRSYREQIGNLHVGKIQRQASIYILLDCVKYLGWSAGLDLLPSICPPEFLPRWRVPVSGLPRQGPFL